MATDCRQFHHFENYLFDLISGVAIAVGLKKSGRAEAQPENIDEGLDYQKPVTAEFGPELQFAAGRLSTFHKRRRRCSGKLG